MKYIVCEEPGKFLLKEKEAPVRKEKEALLRVKKVGICGTDLHATEMIENFDSWTKPATGVIKATVDFS
ncbi:hypothetical protein AXE80_11870 [Wenyingzhuangia fucanilytica]|uniref:Uncharacterized protein n=1 Tax=Wenyingzhuangia fucanilytica TaxID=1790137 RepID=A0A1B1Y852_9FLAO|nr:hypothetical protein AXE80_11870 [Wenyingzhuangia fucanilytica]